MCSVQQCNKGSEYNQVETGWVGFSAALINGLAGCMLARFVTPCIIITNIIIIIKQHFKSAQATVCENCNIHRNVCVENIASKSAW
jgi:hypothetical protein